MSASKDFWITAHSELVKELKREPTHEELAQRFRIIRNRASEAERSLMRIRGMDWTLLMQKPVQRFAMPERLVDLG